jgi:hypothetical protein
VDLVIRNEKDMDYFLKYLIHNLSTIDGCRDSANGILKVLDMQNGNPNKNRHEVFRKIYVKYLIMRVRAKISFMALQKRCTVMELFVNAIIYSYKALEIHERKNVLTRINED